MQVSFGLLLNDGKLTLIFTEIYFNYFSVSSFLPGLWALTQAKYSKLDFDFLG